MRVPRTEAHFEALRKRVEALQEYADVLESMLDKCKREHGGSSDDPRAYLQLRPQESAHDELQSPEFEEENPSSDNDIGQELSVATQSLTVRPSLSLPSK